MPTYSRRGVGHVGEVEPAVVAGVALDAVHDVGVGEVDVLADVVGVQGDRVG
jgi:hypothetical protein